MDELLPRSAQRRLEQIASWLRIVIVNGPRQSGKTTLLREYQRIHGGTYVTLDDEQALAEAHRDPVTFVRHGEQPLLIDEVQRGGDRLVRAVKMVVDERQDRGQFLLSGSAKFLTIPTLAESLAGRAGFLDLWPLSVAERTRSLSVNFCDALFADPAALAGSTSTWSRAGYLDLIVDGGYPELIALRSTAARPIWFDGYLATIITRDIGDIAHVQQASLLPRLLALVAARSGTPLVQADLARSLELNRETIRNYLAYLEMVFLVTYVPAWSTNLTSKIAKTAKVFVSDSGLMSHLLKVNAGTLSQPGHPALGGLVETFVMAELVKLQTTAETRFSIHHLRERDGREIDFILEGPDGRIIAIEVKASVSPPRDADRHLRRLREQLGDRMIAGVLLHLGARSGSLGNGLYAMPISALWNHADTRYEP